MVLLLIIASVVLVSLASLVGIFSLFLKETSLDRIIFYLVSFAAGSLLGAAFLDLLPEAIAKSASELLYFSALLGLIVFFVMEKFLRWHHHHKSHCEAHPIVYMNLIGDSFHNFLDGMIIAAGFIVSTNIGIITTLAVLFHEIPQEIGDFGVLLYGGLSKTQALLYNFSSALVSIFGAIITYFIASEIVQIAAFLLAFAAGGFIYIAAADIIPELQKEVSLKKSFVQFLLFFAGILIIWVLIKFF